MSNFKRLVAARMAETGEGWQAASMHVRAKVLAAETEAIKDPSKRDKNSPIRSYRVGVFLGPKLIEPGQTVEFVRELKESEWPWTANRLSFPAMLMHQGLVVTDVSVGRTEQAISASPIPLEVFQDGQEVLGVNLGTDMITMEEPLKVSVRNDGPKSQLVIGHMSGLLHEVTDHDELGDWSSPDADHAMLLLEQLVVQPGETRTARLSDSPHHFERQQRLADDKEYTITRLFTHAIDGVEVDIRIDGESQTSGFVDGARLSAAGAAIEFNRDLGPAVKFTKKYVKDKTAVEVIVKNTTDRPRSFDGSLMLARALSAEELEARRQQGLMPWSIGPMMGPALMPVGGGGALRPMPPIMSRAWEERFPWNIDGNRETIEVKPGETVQLPAQVQLIFRGEQLVVDEECRGLFEIIDVKVGRAPSPLFKKPIAGKHFIAHNTLDLKLDVATPGIILRLIVKNLTNTPQKFGATLKGLTMQ